MSELDRAPANQADTERMGVTRSYVSRVARGEHRSEEVEQTLIQEFEDLS